MNHSDEKKKYCEAKKHL